MKSHGEAAEDRMIAGEEIHALTGAGQVFSIIGEWHLTCLSSCVIQRSKSDVRFPPPSYVSGSRTAGRNTIGHAGPRTDDDGLSAFLRVRRRLFGIAYRILKSAAEAEDIVQDVWIRWQTTDRSAVRDAAAFLARATTRLAINVIESARSRRETSVGPSLPESVDASADPELQAERSEALQNAALVLLEKLSPAERAAFVLREAFDYSYREIASILRLKEANARQLATRARRHVTDGRCAVADPAEQQWFLAAFVTAAGEGALTGLESFLCRNRLWLGCDVERGTAEWAGEWRGHGAASRSSTSGHDCSTVMRERPSSLADDDLAPWRGPIASPLADDDLSECVRIASSNESGDKVTLYEGGATVSLRGRAGIPSNTREFHAAS